MSIAIDKDKCISCGRCVTVCPGSLIKQDEQNKAYIKYPKDCWGCCSCVKECPTHAISLYLGADIGGMGSRMHTEEHGDILSWIIEKYDGTTEIIDINRKESNKY